MQTFCWENIFKTKISLAVVILAESSFKVLFLVHANYGGANQVIPWLFMFFDLFSVNGNRALQTKTSRGHLIWNFNCLISGSVTLLVI